MTTGSWQVQTAKQRFSEMIRAAEAGDPQFITKHGRPVAVVVDIEEYRRNHRPSLAEFLVSSCGDLDLPDGLLELPSRATPDRVLDLPGIDE